MKKEFTRQQLKYQNTILGQKITKEYYFGKPTTYKNNVSKLYKLEIKNLINDLRKRQLDIESFDGFTEREKRLIIQTMENNIETIERMEQWEYKTIDAPKDGKEWKLAQDFLAKTKEQRNIK